MIPKEGYLVVGRSENFNHGPLSMTCMDLVTGEIVFDLDSSAKREFESGSDTDAATIAILYAICYSRRNGLKPVIYTSNPNALRRVSELQKPNDDLFGNDVCDTSRWNPLIGSGVKAVGDFSDVELRLWTKDEFGENPLKSKNFWK